MKILQTALMRVLIGVRVRLPASFVGKVLMIEEKEAAGA
jgi:hypothetical protein